MAATGANIVRLFVNLTLDSSTDTYTSDLTDADSVVSSGAQFGFKVVLVFQPLTSQSVPEFWADTHLQASIAANWLAAATRYEGNPTIAGYDLINEPIAPSGQAQWVSIAAQLIASIRSVDPDHVIIFEPSPGAIPEAFPTMTADIMATMLPIKNIVYSVHDYEPYHISSQGILYFTSLPYPTPANSIIGLVDKATLSDLLEPVRQFVAQYHVPIYVGEFSCVRWAPVNASNDYSANSYVADQISLFEAEGYSWNYHAWRAYPGWDAELPESFFYQFPYTNAMPHQYYVGDVPGWLHVLTNGNYSTDDTDTMVLLKQYFKGNAH